MNSLFKLIEIKDTIVVPPRHITTADSYILNILKKKENKCTKFGYIKNIDKLIHKSDPIIYELDFSGNLIYNIIYTAYVCDPEINSIINCKIIQIVVEDQFIVAENYPLFINVIIDDNIDELNKLKLNDNIKVEILAKRLNLNNDKIKIVAKYKNLI